MIDHRAEVDRIRSMEWDLQPEGYERLISDYAIALAHAQARVTKLENDLAKLRNSHQLDHY
jgi:hypothetical protein